jgi:hypothetical protein
MSHRTHILAGNTVVEINTPDDPIVSARAAQYSTLAVAAMRAQHKPISSIAGYVERTHSRACTEDPQRVAAAAARWVANVHGRSEWLGTVCDAKIFGRSRQDDGSFVRIEVDSRVTDAAQNLFGHAFGDECPQGGFNLCPICRLADSGDWASALRRIWPRDEDYDRACAALYDGYKAARLGGLVDRVELVSPGYSPARKRPLRDGEPEF